MLELLPIAFVPIAFAVAAGWCIAKIEALQIERDQSRYAMWHAENERDAALDYIGAQLREAVENEPQRALAPAG